jgi:hypothetical protein
MCVPMTISPSMAPAGGGRQPNKNPADDPERVSEAADVVGDRPDSEKPVQVLEDYYKSRKRRRRLALLREQGGNRRQFERSPMGWGGRPEGSIGFGSGGSGGGITTGSGGGK